MERDKREEKRTRGGGEREREEGREREDEREIELICSGPLDSRFNSPKIKCRFHVGQKCQIAPRCLFLAACRHLSDSGKNELDGSSRTVFLQVPSRN